MRIVFFGTSHGYPEPHKKCSSIMIEVGEKRYIIDMGTDITTDLIDRGLRPECLSAIFVTHMHGDHYCGLAPFLYTCNWLYKTTDFALYLPADINQFANAVDAWLGLRSGGMTTRKYDYRRISEGTIYDDGVLKVTAYMTKHCEESYALLLEAEGKRVLYTGDLSSKQGPEYDFPTSALESTIDLLICEGAHFPATKYLPIYEGCKTINRIWVTHFKEARIGSIYELKEMLPDKEIVLVKDGMETTV